MSEETRYTIEVRDDAVEITGTLTIREAFDFLAFFEREGFTTLEDWGERTTLYFRKRNIDQELTDRVNKNTLDELEDVKKDYKGLLNTNIEQAQKIKELEGLIKNHMIDESERFKALKKENEKLEKFKILQHLKDSPEAAKICAMEGPVGEEISPFSPLSEGTIE